MRKTLWKPLIGRLLDQTHYVYVFSYSFFFYHAIKYFSPMPCFIDTFKILIGELAKHSVLEFANYQFIGRFIGKYHVTFKFVGMNT